MIGVTQTVVSDLANMGYMRLFIIFFFLSLHEIDTVENIFNLGEFVDNKNNLLI